MGDRLADRNERAAGDQGQDGADAAGERLRALRATGDVVADEVGVQRPVGLVGDEVGREEDRQREPRRADRPDEAQQREREDQRRRGAEHERQAAADRR
jgi:hypothetical protein